jgi:hypothetical protein
MSERDDPVRVARKFGASKKYSREEVGRLTDVLTKAITIEVARNSQRAVQKIQSAVRMRASRLRTEKQHGKSFAISRPKREAMTAFDGASAGAAGGLARRAVASGPESAELEEARGRTVSKFARDIAELKRQYTVIDGVIKGKVCLAELQLGARNRQVAKKKTARKRWHVRAISSPVAIFAVAKKFMRIMKQKDQVR